jgi:hypothetical protein
MDEHFRLREFYKIQYKKNWQILMAVWMNNLAQKKEQTERLITCLKCAKRRGYKSFLKKDKLIVNGKFIIWISF